MKKGLKKILNGLDDIDFRELHYAISIADTVRHSLKRYVLTIEQFAEKLCEPVEMVKEMITGGYEFDLRMMSKIDSLRETLEAEKSQKNIIPIISFPDYKYSKPASEVIAYKSDAVQVSDTTMLPNEPTADPKIDNQ